MNNKERFKIAVECLKDIKPLKEICVLYRASDFDLRKYGLENKIKIPKDDYINEDFYIFNMTTIYHLTESNKILGENQYYDIFNEDDNYRIILDKYGWSYNNKYIALELRYIEKANVFALCNYAVECPEFGTAKVDFIGALIIVPDKCAKLYKVKSQKEIWEQEGIGPTLNNYLNFICKNRSSIALNNSDASWNETFGKLFPLIHYRKGEYLCTIDTMFHLGGWMLRDEPRYKNTDKQKQINKLLKLPLKEVTKKDLAFRKETKFGKRAFIEHVKDDMICIRYFQQNDFTEEIFEIMRFYIDKKNTYFCQKNSFNQFVATSLDKEPDAIEHFDTNETIFDKSSSFEGTIIDYYKDIIESDIKMDATQILLNCIYCPPFEKFWKQDFKENIYHFTESGHCSFNGFLEYNFGKINSSANSPRKILGINEYQLATIRQFDWEKQAFIIRHAKYMVGDKTLPSLTNKQTDKLFSIIEKNCKYGSHQFYECFGLLREMYSLKTAFSMADDLIAVALNNDTHYLYTYRDYLNMVEEMEMTSIYHPQFKDKNDIEKIHDEVLEIYNAKKFAIENEKFAKRIEDLKKFEYTSGEFSVVAPTKAEDLANEGVKLHHCVKSYIGRVANGETNIVFIRKNTDLEKPFFTIEITNDNTIQQVHGLKNRNADTEPGLTKFVKEWAKDKNLTLCDINKIR